MILPVMIYLGLVFLTLMQCTRNEFYQETCFDRYSDEFFTLFSWAFFLLPTLVFAPVSLLVFSLIQYNLNYVPHDKIRRAIHCIDKPIKCIYKLLKIVLSAIYWTIKLLFRDI